jgi:adenine-specific DNA-methyltransferase
VEVLAFDSKRYVGAQIGIHGPTGEKVGEVKRLRNVEYLFLAGDPDRVASASAATTTGGTAPRGLTPTSSISRSVQAAPATTD